MRASLRRFGVRSTPAFMTFLPPDNGGEVHRGARDIDSWREVGASLSPTADIAQPNLPPDVVKPTPLRAYTWHQVVKSRLEWPGCSPEDTSRCNLEQAVQLEVREIAEIHPR